MNLITVKAEDPLEVEEDLTAFMVGADTSTANSSAAESEADTEAEAVSSVPSTPSVSLRTASRFKQFPEHKHVSLDWNTE